jgi:hypothetical protein
MSDDLRRASAAFTLYDETGTATRSGDTLAVVEEDRLSVGPLSVCFLDADALRAADHRLEIDLWPSGRLLLTGLGRRFDTFAQEVRRARNHTRVAGLLAHGITTPDVFEGALIERSGPGQPVEIQVYDTHVTIVPKDGLPWQVPLGALDGVEAVDSPPGVRLRRMADSTSIGLLARHRDTMLDAVARRIDLQGRLLSDLTGHERFADGRGLKRSEIPEFDRLLDRFTARERVDSARTVLAATDGDPRLGFVQLLDPDSDALRAPDPIPAHWAAFLLVPVGGRTVVELLSGPSAATYVFAGDIDATNRDLQALHFRRAPLALPAEQAEPTLSNPYRLALRALEPLQRLRAATRARLVHTDGWRDAFRAAVS